MNYKQWNIGKRQLNLFVLILMQIFTLLVQTHICYPVNSQLCQQADIQKYVFFRSPLKSSLHFMNLTLKFRQKKSFKNICNLEECLSLRSFNSMSQVFIRHWKEFTPPLYCVMFSSAILRLIKIHCIKLCYFYHPTLAALLLQIKLGMSYLRKVT